jgi:hypothetical protein
MTDFLGLLRKRNTRTVFLTVSPVLTTSTINPVFKNYPVSRIHSSNPPSEISAPEGFPTHNENNSSLHAAFSRFSCELERFLTFLLYPEEPSLYRFLILGAVGLGAVFLHHWIGHMTYWSPLIGFLSTLKMYIFRTLLISETIAKNAAKVAYGFTWWIYLRQFLLYK